MAYQVRRLHLEPPMPSLPHPYASWSHQAIRRQHTENNCSNDGSPPAQSASRAAEGSWARDKKQPYAHLAQGSGSWNGRAHTPYHPTGIDGSSPAAKLDLCGE